MEKLKITDVEFSHRIEPDQDSFEGFVLASGDDEVDRAAELAVAAQLAGGNEFAWCCAVVTAVWRSFDGVSVLGGISCRGLEDFLSDILPDMKIDALDDLNAAISRAADDIAVLGH